MIVRLSSCGKSFKGLSAYLTHDPDAETDKRVAWTHTENLANDHVPAAVNEMYQTAQNAELLKQEAGIRGGGRATVNTAKHFSLNWAPGETPSREHMIETTTDFLRHMGWQDHQAILVAHNDKLYSHVHCMLNVVHPETGLRLNEDFEKRRAQKWALEYEREHGLHCEQRLKDARDREASVTRPAWTAFNEQKKIFENEESHRRANSEIQENGKTANFDDWKKLKEIQREEREEFFSNGKSRFSDLRRSVYREIHEEFRGRWSDYFFALRGGQEDLADVKAAILADQKSALESRRDSACAELRKSRDTEYRGLLDRQKGARADLRAWQMEGRDTAEFFRDLGHLKSEPRIRGDFRETAQEVAQRQESQGAQAGSARPVSRSSAATSAANSTINTGISTGLGLASGPLSILGRLFAEFVNGPPAANQNREEDPNPFAAAAEEARRHTEREEQRRRDADMEERQRVRTRD